MSSTPAHSSAPRGGSAVRFAHTWVWLQGQGPGLLPGAHSCESSVWAPAPPHVVSDAAEPRGAATTSSPRMRRDRRNRAPPGTTGLEPNHLAMPSCVWVGGEAGKPVLPTGATCLAEVTTRQQWRRGDGYQRPCQTTEGSLFMEQKASPDQFVCPPAVTEHHRL